jgi:hypothetical protein
VKAFYTVSIAKFEGDAGLSSFVVLLEDSDEIENGHEFGFELETQNITPKDKKLTISVSVQSQYIKQVPRSQPHIQTKPPVVKLLLLLDGKQVQRVVYYEQFPRWIEFTIPFENTDQIRE